MSGRWRRADWRERRRSGHMRVPRRSSDVSACACPLPVSITQLCRREQNGSSSSFGGSRGQGMNTRHARRQHEEDTARDSAKGKTTEGEPAERSRARTLLARAALARKAATCSPAISVGPTFHAARLGGILIPSKHVTCRRSLTSSWRAAQLAAPPAPPTAPGCSLGCSALPPAQPVTPAILLSSRSFCGEDFGVFGERGVGMQGMSDACVQKKREESRAEQKKTGKVLWACRV
eukprot:570668-Rhodomonas_salina.1